jgi:hypothetical protein
MRVLKFGLVIERSFVTAAWPAFGLLMEETTCRRAGWLQMYWLSSRGQSTRDSPPVCGLMYRPNTPRRQTVMKYYEMSFGVADCCEFFEGRN